jgi:hypothetical protein
MKFRTLSLFAGLFLALVCLQPQSSAADLRTSENEYYKMITIPVPQGMVLEAGALQWMPNGQLAVSTRLGNIYMLDHSLDDPPANVKFNLFASGLHEVLGLTIDKNGVLYCTQRGEVTRIKDLDQDDKADLFETVSDFWSISGDYHEYAFGSKFDKEGNIWVVLTLTGSFTSEAPFRGWCVRVSPDGKTIPTCSGIRSPGGIGTNSLGDMFYTDNQGPWNGTCELKQLLPGAFEGHPAGNIWYKLTDAIGPRPPDPVSGSRFHIEAKRIPQYIPPVILFPYNKMGQSASGIADDTTGGKFGPFSNQLFVGDQTHSTVMRVQLEKVNGRYQGALFPFRQGFDSGVLSEEFAADGSLFVYGTDRGWGSRGGKPFALQRLVWSGKVPFEVHEMHARHDGFDFTFTEPVDAATVENPDSWTAETYTYIFQASYGSPEVDRTKPTIKKITVNPDRKSAHIVLDGLQEGHVHEFHLTGIRSANGQPLLHQEAYYTLNQIPGS